MNQVRININLIGDSTGQSVPKRRGRPKDANLRKQILEKARELFLEHGFQVISVDTIANAASVSNRTIFSHFASKEELLWAIVREEGEALRPSFPSQLPDSSRQFSKSLTEFGVGLVSMLTSPNIIRLGKLIVSESIRHPDMARSFYEWGPMSTRTILAKWIEHGKSKGWLSRSTPPHAGDHLLALWQGCWHLPQQLGINGKLSNQRVRSHVQECLELFLRAYSR